MARQTLSAVIMTKNVESLIEDCLKSVTWADEIIVVDGFSTDRTVEICRRYTDKIIQNRWEGYRFDTERNLGTGHASGDWILQIDPDERATEEFREAVLKILDDHSCPYAAYEYRKKNFFLGHWMRHGGWYHYSLHLFKKGLAHYDGVIHESLKVNGKVGKIEAPVEHYPFHSLGQFVERHNGYSSREAKAILEKEGVLDERRIRYEIRIKPLKRFFKFYIRKKGFLDGLHGFIFSVLYAWVHFINWIKYWELIQSHPSSS